MKTDEMTIRELVATKRKEKGISQSELAEKVGVRTATISDYETGKFGISADTLEKVFKVLDIRIQQDLQKLTQWKEAKTVAAILFEKRIDVDRLSKKEMFELTGMESIMRLLEPGDEITNVNEHNTYGYFHTIVKFHTAILKKS
jgi:transcriptional regulator with XRE-family HTH domain